MATETVDRRSAHRRSIKVTSAASLVGVIAGVLTQSLAAGPTDRISVAILIASILAVQGVIRLLGVDIQKFTAKDHLYVAFMTFTLWFITWTILLTTDVSL